MQMVFTLENEPSFSLNKQKLAEIDFQEVLNLADSAICLLDVDGSIVYSNKKANDYFLDSNIKAQINQNIPNNALISSKNRHFKVSITKLNDNLTVCAIKNISENVSLNNEIILLQEIETSMNNVLELNSLLNLILNGIKKLGFDSASMYLIDEESNIMEGVISTSFSKHVMKSVKIRIEKSPFLREIIKRKHSVFAENLKEFQFEIEKELLLENNVRSFLCLPLLVEGGVTGILTANITEERHNKFDLNILQLFANDAALAINRALLYDKLNNFNKQLRKKIKFATKELRAKNIRLKEADELKTQLLSIISHELRTPLTSIKGYSSLLVNDKIGCLTKEQKECIRIIDEESDKLKTVIDDVLNLSRLVSGKDPLALEKIDIIKIISEVIDSNKKHIEEKEILVNFNYEEVIDLNIDPEKIKQALSHLISNAIKFNKKGGRINIKILNNPYFVQVSVKDTGIGIEKSSIEKIFEEFYQLEDHLTRVGMGTGVGLSIAKEIINLHKGDIWVKSTPGKSSTFYFTLPKNLKPKVVLESDEKFAKTIEELETIRAISGFVQKNFDLKQILHLILQGIRSAVGFDRVRLYLYDKEKSVMNGTVAIGNDSIDKISIDIKPNTFVSKIIHNRKAVLIKDSKETPYNKELGKKSDTPFAAVPLIIRNDVIGLIAGDNVVSGKIITQQNLNSFTAFANNAAIVIEYVRLYEEMEKKVKERTKQLEDFMNYVSHEMRTPLTSLIGYSRLLSADTLDQKSKAESIGILNREATRLKVMIDDYLDLSKLEYGKHELRMKNVDLSKLINDVAKVMVIQSDKKNLHFNYRCNSAVVNADEEKIKQVLFNLLSNAIKFTEKGKVGIKVADLSDYYLISVSDTGIGIKDEDKEKVFDKFRQIEHGHKTEKGTGLGLIISKKIIESHKGKVWFDSSYGKGSTFYFTLPKNI